MKGKHGETIALKQRRVNYLIKYEVRLGGQEPDELLKENLKEIATDMNRLNDELYDLKKVRSLSVDLNSYIKFRNIMPYVTKLVRGGTDERFFWIPDEERGKKVDYTLNQVKFGRDFVIELGLIHS